MFGGKLEAGTYNITDEMWVFNIPGRTWSPRKPAPPPPYAVEGHTAHVVELSDGEPTMLVFFGYSPIYSYINKVQEYNIREFNSISPLPETNMVLAPIIVIIFKDVHSLSPFKILHCFFFFLFSLKYFWLSCE